MKTIRVRLLGVQRLPNGFAGGLRYALQTDKGVYLTNSGVVTGYDSISRNPVWVHGGQEVELDLTWRGRVYGVAGLVDGKPAWLKAPPFGFKTSVQRLDRRERAPEDGLFGARRFLRGRRLS